MSSLINDLQEKKNSLVEFENITVRVLEYLPNVLSEELKEKNGYNIHFSQSAGTTKYIRPINQRLFIYSSDDFKNKLSDFHKLIEKLKTRNEDWSDWEKELIDSVLYTIQQSIGAGFDLLANPNSARKHVGNRFEELILSPYTKVKSSGKHLDEHEIVVSVKTTSKDRMGKMFIDKILLERFVNHEQKVIGVFLNDVQRMKKNNISFTLVSGLFMVYSNFLTELEGIYYLDPAPNVLKEPYNKYMKPFSELVTRDIWNLLTS